MTRLTTSHSLATNHGNTIVKYANLPGLSNLTLVVPNLQKDLTRGVIYDIKPTKDPQIFKCKFQSRDPSKPEIRNVTLLSAAPNLVDLSALSAIKNITVHELTPKHFYYGLSPFQHHGKATAESGHIISMQSSQPHLNDELTRRFASLLRHHLEPITNKHFDFSGMSLSKRSIEHLVRAIQETQAVLEHIHFNLENCNICNDGAKTIANKLIQYITKLNHNTSLTISLKQNPKITDEGLAALTTVIQQSKTAMQEKHNIKLDIQILVDHSDNSSTSIDNRSNHLRAAAELKQLIDLFDLNELFSSEANLGLQIEKIRLDELKSAFD
jgi:hypothetical protein